LIRYAITDASRFGETAEAQLAGLLADARRWAAEGVEFVQLREKMLAAEELMRLTEAILTIFRESGGRTKLLVNGRADIAIAAGADGVHLTSNSEELAPEQVRQLYAHAGLPKPVVSAACHSVADTERARAAGADLILFGPVFEKRIAGELVVGGTGLELLREVCAAAGETPVVALGGVTTENAAACLAAGASGVAGIRLFS
jgi:thiamine-phosphate pyrophosphorylase